MDSSLQDRDQKVLRSRSDQPETGRLRARAARTRKEQCAQAAHPQADLPRDTSHAQSSRRLLSDAAVLCRRST